jgi:hypothetical protein
MPDIHQRILLVIREIVSLLVQGNFESVQRLSKGIRLTAEEMRDAIEEYGRQLVMPPSEAFESLDVVKVDDVEPQRWSVRFDLWTKKEGRSDLSLELTLIERTGESLDVEIDDIHVL